MRYPVDNYLSEWNNSAGYDFGDRTDYGFHEGKDINDSGGGDSDLGKSIKAIAKGELVYYHTYHPTKNFGDHHVYKITGPWGTRWIHEAHCQPGLLITPGPVAEGQEIAKVGKSGTPYAHIHFSVFKVDPATLRNGIDTIAKTEQELHTWWEDPIAFIQKWIGGGGSVDNISIPKSTFEELVGKSTKYDNFVKAGFVTPEDVNKKISELTRQRDDNWNQLVDTKELLRQERVKVNAAKDPLADKAKLVLKEWLNS